MKITGGNLRGRALVSPESAKTHPMGSRERLALFNSLQPYLSGAQVLDAYAGTGALGLEAISRGAAHATFIEKDHSAAAALRQNIATLGVEHQTTLVENSVENFQSDTKFDLILADPPYDQISAAPLSRLAGFLSVAGVLVISHPADFDATAFADVAHLRLLSTKSYAAARISLFAR
ncbi:16S rRNA (guanine(966)-N(2))-methyltransferase RsmD [Candidatus Saccharibacteria bacterium]|nr:16S rRNA (guanine(966)-N(2))-methyltransferase RsmD [Candidatus Saccharibacteria bacterium]